MTPDNSDHAKQIETILELIIDLYAKNEAIAAVILETGSNRDELLELERVARQKLLQLPGLSELSGLAQISNLEVIRQSFRDFRG